MKYETPRLSRFGAFRELTRIGLSGTGDPNTVKGNGCGSAGHLDCRS